MRSLRDKKGCFSLAALIGNEIAKFVFESWEEKRASKDIVSWEQGFEMLQAFSSGKIAQLVGCSKGEGGKPASKQAQPGFDFPKRCLGSLHSGHPNQISS